MSWHNLISVQISKIIQICCKICTLCANIQFIVVQLSCASQLACLLCKLFCFAISQHFASLYSCFDRSFVRSLSLALRSQKSESSSCTNQQYYKDICCRCEFESVFQYHGYDILEYFTPSPFCSQTLKCLHIVLYNLNELFGTFAYTKRFYPKTHYKENCVVCNAAKDAECR